MGDCAGHDNDFTHLDLDVPGLTNEFHLGWKLGAVTDGPPGFSGEPYIPLWVSVLIRESSVRREASLDYALSRSFWARQDPLQATEADGRTLRQLVLERLPDDLRELDAGREPEALRRDNSQIPRKFLRP